MQTTPSPSLPAPVFSLLRASLRLLVTADEAAARATQASERLRSTASLLPLPRRSYDEL